MKAKIHVITRIHLQQHSDCDQATENGPIPPRPGKFQEIKRYKKITTSLLMLTEN